VRDETFELTAPDVEPIEQDTEEEFYLADDERTWREKFPSVDAATLKGRKYGSDFSAALKSIAHAEGWDDADVTTALALMDAARRADYSTASVQPSIMRRFPCSAWYLELYYRRETLPDFASEEEEDRFKNSYGRSWRRRFDSLHDKQCRTHHGFFTKDDPDNTSARKRKACLYTDRLTDTLNQIIAKSRTLRGYPVDRFERARFMVMQEFEAAHPRYAPDWTEPAIDLEPEKAPEKAKGDQSADAVLKAVRRLARRSRKFAANLGMDEDEALAFRLRLQQEFECAWTDDPGDEPPSDDNDEGSGDENESSNNISSSVSYMADKKIREAPMVASSCVATPEALCENTEENSKNRRFSTDRFVLTKSPSDASPEERARQTIDAFESVGVTEFKTVFLSRVPVGGNARCVGSEEVAASEIRARLAGYIRRSERQEQSVCLRPRDGQLIQLDDCPAEVVERLAPYSFLTVETSPQNYQSWIALPLTISNDERVAVRERLLRQLKDTGANGGAYNSVRLPGALNAKQKYKDAGGHYPRVRLVASAPGLVVAPQLLEAAGLLAAPLPEKVVAMPTYSNTRLPEREADYYEYLRRSGKSDTDKPDRSNADICYAMVMLKMGWPRHYVAARINDHSQKAQGRRDNYATRTTDVAARFLAADVASSRPVRRADAGRQRMAI
jgi:hypothetical protein